MTESWCDILNHVLRRNRLVSILIGKLVEDNNMIESAKKEDLRRDWDSRKSSLVNKILIFIWELLKRSYAWLNKIIVELPILLTQLYNWRLKGRMSEEKAIRVVSFDGKVDNWRMWKLKFMAKASQNGYKGAIDGTLVIPIIIL